MLVKERKRIESKILRCLIKCITQEGYLIRVFDGAGWAGEKSRDAKEIFAQCRSTDQDELCVYHPDKPNERFGWVLLVYGNDGFDVICDHTVNMEEVIAPATAMAEREAEAAS